MMLAKPLVSAVMPILGDYFKIYQLVETFVSDLKKEYRSSSGRIEIIFVVNGDTWLRSIPFESLRTFNVKIISATTDELPAALYNKGVNNAQSEFISFVWPGVEFRSWLNCLERMCDELTSKKDVLFLAGKPAPSNRRKNLLESWKINQLDNVPFNYQSGWLEMFDYVPMGSSVLSRDYFLSKGGFSCSPLLQKRFWWEFTIRTTRTESICLVDIPSPDAAWSWDDFPLNSDLSFSGDLIARYVVRNNLLLPVVSEECDWSNVYDFMNDLPYASFQHVKLRISEWCGEKSRALFEAGLQQYNKVRKIEPLKVVVLGGLYEPAHNQLCFFNYFALLEGRGLLTWRVIYDAIAQPVDMLKADLVIFSRIKSDNGGLMMDYCKQYNIPTIYMLDDNWFVVGRDWPEYANILSPGTPLFKSFMYCLERADHVLTYNEILAEDLRPYCSKLTILPTNIDLSLFPEKPTQNSGRSLRIGYIGSIRYELSAFLALAELANEINDFDIFIMSPALPPAFEGIDTNRLIFQPYLFGYRHYADVLCKNAPDILLAPLGNTRTEASKCPNKYLEITAVGAVGIYSKTAPYDKYISHMKNGLLVENDIKAWKDAIKLLIDNPKLHADILANAQQDVRQNFATQSVLPTFWKFLSTAVDLECENMEMV